MIYHWNSLDVLKNLSDNSIDAIITDPPYELWFMGKSWDKTWIASNVELWGECLRVLKPWGHLLAFSGTRTYHRMASAIEDAGFEVRDMIEWVYGSWFPASLNIGKAINKIDGESSERAKEWEWWWTALKPAHEPICMARKPLEKWLTIAENCLKWGTDGINIEISRVETEEKISIHNAPKWTFAWWELNRWSDTESYRSNTQGRFPANLIHDWSEEVRECFPETKSGEVKHTTNNFDGSNNINIGGGILSPQNSYGDSWNASRFFKSIIYQAKASKSDRWEWNNHPTVKPTPLMEYLINMITRPWQTVLDPFMWSWTTWVACVNTWREFTGIEMEKDYIVIAENRIKHAHISKT